MPIADTTDDVERQAASKNSILGTGNSKYIIIGGLALVVVLVMLFGKNGKSGAKSSNQGNASGVDPSTGFPVGSSADVAALRTYGALGGGGRFNMGAYPTAKGGTVSGIGLGGAYMPPYEPVNQTWINGLAEPSYPVGPAGPPGPGNSGATGMNQADILTSSQALTTLSTVPINEKSYNHTRVYRVKPGDNLAGIASKFGVAGGYTSLYRHNQHTIGPNPDMLIPGTLIYL